METRDVILNFRFVSVRCTVKKLRKIFETRCDCVFTTYLITHVVFHVPADAAQQFLSTPLCLSEGDERYKLAVSRHRQIFTISFGNSFKRFETRSGSEKRKLIPDFTF